MFQKNLCESIIFFTLVKIKYFMGKLNVLLFIFTAVVISACNNDNNNPAPTGSNEIVYTEFVNDSTIQILAQNIDGSNKRVLVGSGLNYLSSQVYSNKFVYSTSSDDGEYSKISLYDLNTNTISKIIEDNTGKYFWLCSLSPTLDKIAFNEDTHPAVVNVDGTNHRTYTNYDIYEMQPVFTTDGNNIVFATQNTDACIFNGKYYSLNLLSNTAISLGLDSYPTTVNDDALRISTNNNKILYNYNYYECDFSGQIINRTSTLSKIDKNGSNKQIIKTESGDGNFYQSVWSNDGLKIASVYNYDIVTMNADGTGLVNLTNATTDEEYYEPQWSPDGSKIIASKFLNNEQFLISIDVVTKEKRTIASLSNPLYDFYYRAFWIK